MSMPFDASISETGSPVLDTWAQCVRCARSRGFKLAQIARYAECTPRLVRLATPVSRQGRYRKDLRRRERFVLRAIQRLASLRTFEDYKALTVAFEPAISMLYLHHEAEKD